MAKTFTVISQQTPEMASSGLVFSGTSASIGVGTPTKSYDVTASATWTGAVKIMVDGDGATGQRFMGIAKGNSTETASANGAVELWEPFPGLIYNGYTKSSSSADTAAEILALKGKRVVFDLTSTDWTVDAAAADAQVNCVTMLGTGNPTLATVNFVYKPTGTYLDFSISA
jgi:hypothetical protein